MIGKVEIKQISDNPTCATLSIDGNTIHCCKGYSIKHFVGEIPVCNIELAVNVDYTHFCDVKIENLEEIAELLDEKNFEKLCDIYKTKKKYGNFDMLRKE